MARASLRCEMLQILKGFELKKMGPGSADTLTAMIEAKRLAYEDLAKYYRRSRLRESPDARIDLRRIRDERRKLIDRSITPIPISAPAIRDLGNGDTTYFTTADKDGMMVSIIQSNYRGMGSGLVADGLGFMFQDRGELFSLDPPARQCLCAGQAPLPHHHPGLRDEGWPALAVVRADGRRHAAARPCAGSRQHDRFRHERAGSGRRRALAVTTAPPK